MFQKSEFGIGHGSAASTWMPASAAPRVAQAAPDWRSRFVDWCEDVDLTPDLGRDIGSRKWFRGLASLIGLIYGAIWISPGIDAVPGASAPLLGAQHYEEVRSQMITAQALGADSGRHMGPTDAVAPLASTPERPTIDLSTVVGNGDGFTRSLQRAGVGESDASTVVSLLAGSLDLANLAPGTRLNMVLGRRASRNVPRPLDRLSFRARLDLAIEINRVDGVLNVTRIPISVDSTPLRIRGRVGPSLFLSARAAGMPAKAIQAYLKVIDDRVSVGNIGSDDMFDIVVGYRRAETGEAEVGDLLYAGLDRASGKSVQMLKWTTGGRTEWFEASGVGQRRGVLGAPVSGGHLSSGFGMRRHPILGYTRMHAGIDFAAPYGSPIYAVTDGTVEYAGWHGGHGRYVKIRHGGGIATGYAHMSRIVAQPGSHVSRGQVIGYVGSTGLSTGPHLHYELYRNGSVVNPLSVSFTASAQLSGRDLSAFRARLADLKRLRIGVPSAPASTLASRVEAMPDGRPVQTVQAQAGEGEIALLPNGQRRALR